MKNWTLVILMVDGFPVKIYVNATNDHAVAFPLFGRYFQLRSDTGVLDFATNFFCARHGNETTFAGYLSSQEDTAIINLDQIAA